MLTVRTTQMEALQRDLDRRFEMAIVADAKRQFPVQAQQIGDAALPAFVHDSVQAALRHSLSGAAAVRFYVFLTVAFTPDLLHNPPTRWIRRILRDAGSSPEARIEQLVQRMETQPDYDSFLKAALS